MDVAIPTVTLRDRLLYSSGVVNYALKDAAFGAFVLFYYKQVLGLSGTLTGLAIAISVVWDAISDPMVGAWSDKLRSRWGRRHPFMVASVVPMALSFVCLFAPPQFALQTQHSLFLWLLGSVLLLRTALTFFMIPYLALGAEITATITSEPIWPALAPTWAGLPGSPSLPVPCSCYSPIRRVRMAAL